ncbi:hypothetical protein [Pendulispora rubella]|uniref:hypothetical protein n=1 Tax=Pendulispora rubella TaxID=2741070 RepID=UPI0030E52E2E
MSEHTGRPIVHRSIAPAELTACGVASLDERIARGLEARTTPFVEEITGERPRSLNDFAATLTRSA